jgi:hypothetical protein
MDTLQPIFDSISKSDPFTMKLPNPIVEEYDPSIKKHKNDYKKDFPKSEKYMPQEIIDYIINTPNTCLRYTHKINNSINYDIKFYCYGENIPLEDIQRQFKVAVWCFSLLSKYANSKCNTVMAKIYLTPFKKMLPNETPNNRHPEPLTAINCNTGLTVPCEGNRPIVIYREEEWLKVLIHETIHYFSIDSNLHNMVLLNGIYAISQEIGLFEAYTEFWAEILLFIAYSFESEEDFKNILLRETQFSLIQGKKILQHQRVRYSDLITSLSPVNYREDTNCMAYYVIKTLFLFYHNEFLEWCRKHNTNLFQFNDDFQDELVEWIVEHGKRQEFIEAIDSVEIPTDEPMRKTLRMTTINI